MDELLRKASLFSKSSAPVLILGESGVGKELLARFIHKESNRKGKFVSVNCSAIPKELFEAELFGYERGAFTNAHQAKAGLIEVAEAGTVFLDEIGELDRDGLYITTIGYPAGVPGSTNTIKILNPSEIAHYLALK